MNVEVRAGAQAADDMLATPVIAKIGVIGAGQMGNGISHVCALAGLPVVLLDVKADALDRAMATMDRNMERQVARTVTTSLASDDFTVSSALPA